MGKEIDKKGEKQAQENMKNVIPMLIVNYKVKKKEKRYELKYVQK